jgi:lipopolysaccharide export system protein LptA
LQAEHIGRLDFRSGEAELEGNVIGHVRSQAMMIFGQSAKAYRNEAREWDRILLDREVRITDPDREITADHGIIKREGAQFSGNVHLAYESAMIDGDELVYERALDRATMRGNPARPLFIQFPAGVDDLAAQADAADEAAADESKELTLAKAQKAVVEQQGRLLTLTGQVRVDIPDRQIHLEAESVILNIAEDNTVTAFQARGDVVIVQPGRRLNSDSARSQNRMQTILLLGKARVRQDNQFDLTSERIEVFTDAKKGTVRSEDRQKPINLSLDVSAGRPYVLDSGKVQGLGDKGVPAATLKKLDPLVGQPFTSQTGFRQAVSKRLTAEEVDLYLNTIVSQAR